jgi:hypothetical protein
MGNADYLALGDWNAACFRCGAKRKASEMRKQWQGYYVCPEHWEPRHPQDFVRGVVDNTSVPWSQPENWAPVGVVMCTAVGQTAIPSEAIPGCMIPSRTQGQFYG